MSDYYVEIVEHGTGTVVKRMGPMAEQKADRVEGGVSINLDHERFYTRVVRGKAVAPKEDQ